MFGADYRTAQRMARALEDTFPGVEIRADEDRRRRWKLHDAGLVRYQGIRDDELAALEMSIRRAEGEGAAPHVAALAALRERLLACMPGPHARRAEADADALLEAQGFAARPGPAVRAVPGVLETIAEALKGPFLLAITYAGADGEEAERRVAPTACCSACAAILSRGTKTTTRSCGTSASTAFARHFSLARASCAGLLRH
jgi:predicted DNA-binding transcriptional regulator YafY